MLFWKVGGGVSNMMSFMVCHGHFITSKVHLEGLPMLSSHWGCLYLE